MTVVRSSPPDIVRAAYVDLVVTDLARARAFWVDLLGFHVTASRARRPVPPRLRGVRPPQRRAPRRPRAGVRPHRVPRPDARRTWTSPSGGSASRGCPTRRVPAGTTRGLGEAVRAVDPLGFTDRAGARDGQGRAARPALRPAPGRQHQPHRPRQHRRPRRAAAAFEYYTSLGFGLSETIEDLSDGTLFAAWMFRKQTVHDVAFTLGAGPMLHHVGVRRARVPRHPRPLRPDRRPRPGGHTSSGGPAATACRTRSTCTCATTTATAWRSTRPTTSPGDPDHEPLRWDVHDERRRDFWANPVVPDLVPGLGRRCSTSTGQPVPGRRAGADRARR